MCIFAYKYERREYCYNASSNYSSQSFSSLPGNQRSKVRNLGGGADYKVATFGIGEDRRNDKTIINSHISEGTGHGIRPNNFGILPVELGLLDYRINNLLQYRHIFRLS
ncbi:hypothetical protein MTR_0122s0040 [Medicago truncatula]|uniref:Uncharacterized protein n=1 Tax=Medicago truncatula TaxID=3880 RepID=A0A072THH2_MEDTR|nr:hypothetical protein MTR_0122s0040 [Medicago truncatula]